MKTPLVDNKYLLQKFPGKGGWTYAAIPEVAQNKESPFGWVKVRGSIDGYEFEKSHLAPMGNGQLFLPVRKEIRKKIKKEAGDYVRVILYPDNEPIEIPEEMLLCLQDEPEAFRFFNSISDNEKQHFIKWIYSSKTDETRVSRMVKSLDRLSNKLKFYD